MRIAVLYDRIPEKGAHPDQQDVLVQAESVAEALRELGHEPMEIQCSLDLKALAHVLKTLNPALVFNLVESLEGCGQLIHVVPAMLDSMRIPYTGSKTDAIYLTTNKLITKRILRSAGITTPAGLSMEDLQKGNTALPGTYIIKSVWEHASIGLEEDSVVDAVDPQQMLMELRRRQGELGGGWFAETYIEGREFNLSVLTSLGGPQVLPPAEILFDGYPSGKRRVVGYRAKWDETSFEYHHTVRNFEFAPGDGPLLQELTDAAMRCWEAFGLRGYARVDFRVDEDKRPWVLEINANPCLSPDAGWMAAATRAGLSYRDVVQRIIQDSLEG